MDNNLNSENRIDSSGADVSLEDILAEFKAEEKLSLTSLRSEVAARSRYLVMESGGRPLGQVQLSSSGTPINPADEDAFPVQDTAPAPAETDRAAQSAREPEGADALDADVKIWSCSPIDGEDPYRYAPKADYAARAARKPLHADVSASAEPDFPVANSAQVLSDAETSEITEERFSPENPEEIDSDAYRGQGSEHRPDFREKVLSPLLGLLAASAVKREEKRQAEKARLETEMKQQLPEMSAQKASFLYAEQASSLKLRCLLAGFLCLVLVYLSCGLPAMGLLGGSLKVRTLVCLVLELVAMVVGLDVFSNGLVALFRRNPGIESLIAVSCLVSIAEAVYSVAANDFSAGLPFCAVSALSITFCLLGYYFNCKSLSLSFRTAALLKNPSVILSEDGGEENGRVLVSLKRPVTGFVRKSEQADIFEKTYTYFAPLLIIFSVVLSLLCYFASDKCDNFLHTLSASISVCASLSAVLGFSFPFYVLTQRLARSGAAIAGFSGCSELGRIRRLVVKDKDLFPVRTLSIAGVSVEEGFFPDKVTAYTTSMVASAGMGIAPVFTELMKKNGYTMRKVEDFACHEGGGIVARIGGDMVYVGSSSFIQLMGIRLQKGAASKSAVYTAINDTLAGVFEIAYTPVTSVQRGLLTLLRSKIDPVFAVRDFNITPMLIKQKFRLPKENFDFPSFADRYRISAEQTEDEGLVAAVFARGGLNAVSGLIKRGRRLYNSVLLCLILSVLGAFIGMLLMLAMCWTGAYDSASCANVIAFMLLWLVPVFVVSYGLKR